LWERDRISIRHGQRVTLPTIPNHFALDHSIQGFFVDIPHDMTLWFRDSFRGSYVQYADPLSAALPLEKP